MQKKSNRSIVHMLLVFVILTTTLSVAWATDVPQQAEPRHIGLSGLTAYLDIISGEASCTSKTIVRTGYTADVKMEIQKLSGSSWITQETWTTSGKGALLLEKVYYVTSGTYQVKVTATVYDSSGKLVESPSAVSSSVKY